jgi:phage terminase small subunit
MGRRKKDSLTAKEVKFVDEYLIDLNPKEAAIRAGYSPKTAAQMGYKLVHKGFVSEAIRAKQQQISHDTGITRDRVLNELAKIAFSNLGDFFKVGGDGDPYFDFSGLTPEQAAAIGELTVEDFKDGRGKGARDVRKIKFKLLDKRGALVDLGKHLGLFEPEKGGAEKDALDQILEAIDGRTKPPSGRR